MTELLADILEIELRLHTPPAAMRGLSVEVIICAHKQVFSKDQQIV